MKTRNFLYYLLVAGIFFLGFFIRTYPPNGFPNGLNQDETAIGYNAYSILKIGKDEYGHKLPLYFKSFGDYKLPVYIYLTVGAIKVFGLNLFAVRLWSSLAGSLSVIIVFFLLRRLTKRRDIPIIASALLAINPWNLFFSQIAFEVNLANLFLLFGVYFFILWVQKKSFFFFIMSTCFFGLSLYTYNVTRIVAPVMMILLCIWYRDSLKKIAIWQKILIGLLFIAMISPFLITLFSGSGLASQKAVLIFGGDSLASITEFRSYLIPLPGITERIFFNDFLLIPFAYFQNLIGFFNPQFFFISGGPFAVSVGNTGMFYLFEAFTIPLGAFIIWKKYPEFKIFLLWFFVVLFIIGLSSSAPHATRDFTMDTPLIIFSTIGIISIFSWINKRPKNIKIALATIFAGVMCYCVAYFAVSFIYRFPTLSAKTYREEDKPLALYLKSQENKYDHILIDPNADFIYTSLLFYQKYPPQLFLKDGIHEKDSSFIHVTRIGKYEFRTINWDKDLKLPHTLIVEGPDVQLPFDPIQTFAYPTRNVVLYANEIYAQYPVVDIAYHVYDTSMNKR